MSNLYSRYEVDGTAIEQGTEVEIMEGVVFRLRSTASEASRKWLQTRIRKNRQQYSANDGMLTPAQQDKQDIDQCAEVLVLGWSGVTSRDGQTLGWTVENCRKLMKELPMLRKDVMYACGEIETFKARQLEAVAGNSDESSSDS